MKKAVIALTLAALAALAAAAAPAQDAVAQGQTLEGLKLTSAILGREVDFAVYLPPDYALSTRRYPVVYLLHGLGDDAAGWIQFGEIHLAADRAIAGREMPPMIIVMPDAKATWYINDFQNKVRYEDMLVQELIPHVDKTYRTRPDRQYRGISGLSMGGWGSLTLGMRHPEMFSGVAAFSAAVWTEEAAAGMEEKMYQRMFAGLFGPRPAGKPSAHFLRLNPLSLAKTLPEAELKKVRYYIDCGDDDFLIEGNCALHIALNERKIPHEFRVRDGAHAWTYWRTGIVAGLAFLGRSFTQ
jgi:enterochelin esterase-like enzyme